MASATPYAGPYAAELVDTAKRLAKGVLAADESPATLGKRLASVSVPNTVANRAALRSLLFTTPGLGRHLGGAILHEETLGHASTADGAPLVAVLQAQGLAVGVKLDAGVRPLHGGAEGETWTAGLDALAAKAAACYARGARFAKWRAVLLVPPTPLALSTAASDLARYAAICQSAGLVPILEPELLSDGAHPAGACEAATCASLAALFAACAAHGVLLEGCVLKPAMVTRGSGCAAASSAPEPAAEVAAATLRALRRAVPPAVPAVLFLSGGQAEAVATDNLRAIVRAAAAAAPAPPWALSFSFGRALQHSTLAAWRGEPANEPDAQAAFAERCATCAAAARGE